MRHKQILLILFVAMIGVTTGVAAETLTPYFNPTLVDANGKFMGHILGYGGYDDPTFSLLFKLTSGENVILRVEKGSNGHVWYRGTLYYASSNCTGSAYVNVSRDAADRIAAVGPGNMLYVSASGSGPSFINSYSNEGVCFVYGTAGSSFIPMNPVVGLDSLFQLPFKTADLSIQSAPAINSWALFGLAITLAISGLLISRVASRI